MLHKLHDEIEKRSGKSWIQTIIDNYDRNESSGFSEFETYGMFCNLNLSKIIERPWRNKNIPMWGLHSINIKKLKRKYSLFYRSVTLPSFMKYSK